MISTMKGVMVMKVVTVDREGAETTEQNRVAVVEGRVIPR